jgi:hypothetical protein
MRHVVIFPEKEDPTSPPPTPASDSSVRTCLNDQSIVAGSASGSNMSHRIPRPTAHSSCLEKNCIERGFPGEVSARCHPRIPVPATRFPLHPWYVSNGRVHSLRTMSPSPSPRWDGSTQRSPNELSAWMMDHATGSDFDIPPTSTAFLS